MASQRELVKELFGAALELDPRERAAFLDRQCKGDRELREEVEALLDADASAGSFLQHPILEPPTANSSGADVFEIVIGPYRLLELIGEGGMGEVWLAEQKQPVRRRVAIKLIKAGMDTREVVTRFESERQALALMDHPAIAKVFDAGSTLRGRPYIAMEYVAGIPITTYCDKHKLTVRQRMELFIPVCEGVQHAHQKAVIHRDLKPSNILVTAIDGKPMPRIIDFGVAKATSQKLTAGTLYTRVGAMVGTLGYMSPEQADPIGEDIDTRTDIYSLGAVLYELLVGAIPLEIGNLPYDEVLRHLRDEDAPRPSSKLRALGSESVAIAKKRGSDPRALVRQLRGDLDAIVLKALEKDRARRYASAAGLAADINRYLHNEPVVAHPPSTAYRARKYVRRHRLGVAVAAIGILLLAGFAIVQSVEVQHIARERDRAQRERDRADRVTQFMTGIFKVPAIYPGSDARRPGEGRGNSVTAREILDDASNEIGTSLNNDPELQAKMMVTLAQSYADLGIYSRAQALVERAVGIQQRIIGPEHRDTLSSMRLLATILRLRQRYDESENLIRQTLAIERRVLGAEDPETLISMNALAITLGEEGRFSEQENVERETLAIRRSVLGPEHPATLGSMETLADALTNGGHYAEAEKLQRQALNIQRRVFGPEDLRTLFATSRLAWTLQREGRLAEAENLQRSVLDIQRRVLGPENPGILFSLESKAIYISLQGHYNSAEKLFREAIKIASKTNEPSELGTAWYAFACGAAVTGHRNEALEYLANAVDHGFAASRWMNTDSDLQSLHSDPRFEALVAKARQNASTQPR
jgi:non-specific serine/threonine protein kinase/serine/threonine-protein kinase